MTITIIPPSRWQPYTIVATGTADLGDYRALRAELARRGVGASTSTAPMRWAIGTANGHSFGVAGDAAQIVGLLRAMGHDLGLAVTEPKHDPA